jgi:hypothetical protein
MCMFCTCRLIWWFSFQILSENCLLPGIIQEDVTTRLLRSPCKASNILCQILTKFQFCLHILMKARNTIFHENSVCGKAVVPCGRKDRHYKSNSRFLANSRPRPKGMTIMAAVVWTPETDPQWKYRNELQHYGIGLHIFPILSVSLFPLLIICCH